MSSKSRNAKRSKHKPSTGDVYSAAGRAQALEQAGKLQNAGDLPRAAAIYQKLLAVEPQNDRALFLLGLLEHQRGDQHAACAHFERLMRLVEAADYRLWYARVLHARGDRQQALAEALRSLELDPRQPSAYHTAWMVLRDLGRQAEALSVLKAGIAATPPSALLYADLGASYLTLEQPLEARAALEQALSLDGSLCAAWINLGSALQFEKQSAAAMLAFEQALALEPNNGDAHYNFGATLENNDQFERAIAHVRRAVELDPEHGNWQSSLASLLSQVGEFDEALRLYRSGLSLCPSMREHSSLLALLQYLPSEADERLPEARRWAALYCPQEKSAPVRRLGNIGSRPLRVGYVSPDFREHSVSYFFEPLLAAHDPSRVTVTCYNSSKRTDAVTARLAQRACMRSIVDLSDAQAAELVQRDEIDVLVDLAGHTVGHRLGVFGYNPAPLQIAYLGYPGTTGLSSIRYRLTDARVDPEPLAQTRYSESLYRLPRVFCCYQPPASAPAVSPLPAATRGQVTFGSLNIYMKVTDPVLQLWAAVLARVPNSRLVLQSRLFADAAACARVRARFSAHGIDVARVELFPPMVLAEHLSLYHQIDIGLDTHPWNGHTTTCLALHMGVPVIALAGDAGASRMGMSVLSAADLPDWVAADEAAYVSLAERSASDLSALGELRQGLRERLQASALCDAASLAREVEDAYFALAQH